MNHWSTQQRGTTLVELLVTLVLGSIVMTTAVSGFTDAWRRTKDHRMIAAAETEARTILDLIAFDLRMTGSGMPIGQSGFLMTNATLGTAVLPILTSSTATNIVFRTNEIGTSTVLTSNYTPSSSLLTFAVFSSTGFSVGNTVYLSDMPVLGTNGFQGTVQSVVGNSVTVSSGYVATSGASFKTGSTVEPVTLLTYSSSSSAGITRNSGSGATLLSPRSSFTASYLDQNSTALALQLTAATIASSLYAIQITISVQTPNSVTGSGIYTALAQQRVALRNVNLAR